MILILENLAAAIAQLSPIQARRLHARIYDRILERCAPILFAGKNFREDNAASTPASGDTTAQENPPAMIGGMTYIVRVHFSTTSKETFSDKVKRLLRNEVRQLMEQEAAGE